MSTFVTAKPIGRSDRVCDGEDVLCDQRTACTIRLMYLICYIIASDIGPTRRGYTQRRLREDRGNPGHMDLV